MDCRTATAVGSLTLTDTDPKAKRFTVFESGSAWIVFEQLQ